MSHPLRSAVAGVLEPSGSPAHPGEEVDQRILDAAGRLFARFGISRVRMNDVAAEAGVSRPTLHRRVGGRTELIQAYLAREALRILADGWGATSGSPLPDRLAALWGAVRRHPVCAKLLTDEWTELSAVVSQASAGDLGRRAVAVLADLLAAEGVADPEATAEATARLFASLTLIPPHLVPPDTDGVRRVFAAVLGRPVPPPASHAGDPTPTAAGGHPSPGARPTPTEEAR